MKKTHLALLLTLVLLLTCVFSAQATGIWDFSRKRQETVTVSRDYYERMQRYEKMDTILQYVETWYYQEPDIDALIENATRGLLYGLEDPYSYYYNVEEWSDMWADDEGEYAGLGLYLLGNYKDYTVTVIRVFEGTPAKDAGIRRGDILVRVEDIEVTAYTMQNAVNVMRGKVGEEVEIEIYRDGEYITMKIPRAVVHVNRIASGMLDDAVGYIALYEFAGESQAEFTAAFEELKNQGAQVLLVDLRDNGGGWVQAAKEIADLFVDAGTLVYSEDRYKTREDIETTDGKDDIPLVFLVNENSASASEILSGGLQDLGRATLVGTQTFGKGIIQTVIPLDETKGKEDGFQMTYAQYYLPSGKAVHKIGITPDVESVMPDELKTQYFQFADLSDPQLKDAYDTARKLLDK